MRLTTIVLGVLVFAVVLTFCGEAIACEGCVHACCVKSEQTQRRRDGIVAQVVKACSGLIRSAQAGSGVALLPSFHRTSPVTISPLLASKVAQLRI